MEEVHMTMTRFLLKRRGAGVLLAASLLLGSAAGALATEIASEEAATWCEGLADFAYRDLRIASTELRLDEAVDNVTLPAHCVLTGYLEDRVGVNDVAYATGFELRLPLDWNDRFYFQGGGGTDGAIRPAIGQNTPGQPLALTLGFAVASTDAGHTGANGRDASFGLDPKARIDWGYNSLDLVTTVSKALLQHSYGHQPSYSYFVGNSNGGRQGLVAAQRFANHFDGILSGAPIIAQSRGHVATAWDLAAMAEMPRGVRSSAALTARQTRT
jgi:hypothetical protein